jgi:hypothetical protein
MTRAPLRFLLTILILWIGVRAAILLPGAFGGIAPVPEAQAEPPRTVPAPASPPTIRLATAAPRSLPAAVVGQNLWPETSRGENVVPTILSPGSKAPAILPSPARQARPSVSIGRPPPIGLPSLPPGPRRAGSSRWSLSAWLLARDDAGGAALAPGGTLGGSQVGARLTYALGNGFSLSGRAYLPLRQLSGAELAAGIDWHPIASLPLSLLAERRQRLGRTGRTAFALTLYGGASRSLTPRVRLDAYGQAGVVGVRRRDLFADGSLRLSRRVGPVELGAGAWGAAQPGAARLDAGPSLSWRLPIPDANLRLQADWRFRIAGDAAPRSGPALTIAADF